MISNIAGYIKLTGEVIAVIRAKTPPEGALQFKEEKWGCVVAMINAASQGKVVAFSEKTVACPGGKSGTGFRPLKLGFIEYFLSVGGNGAKEGEYYKETPELARNYVEDMPSVTAEEYLVLKPLSRVEETDTVSSVVFLVNPDQLSALVTLANFDQPTQDNVQIKFGAGCAQSLLYSMADGDAGKDICTIGLTDPSARKCIDREILSFSIPYKRFREMERKAEGSFLTKETWQHIAKRI